MVLSKHESAIIGMCGKMGTSIRCGDAVEAVFAFAKCVDSVGRVGGTAEFSWGGILIYYNQESQ